MIKVTCQIPDQSTPAKSEIKVHNHWNSRKWVEIEIEGKRYTVNGSDMITAINNCTNTNEWG